MSNKEFAEKHLLRKCTISISFSENTEFEIVGYCDYYESIIIRLLGKTSEWVWDYLKLEEYDYILTDSKIGDKFAYVDIDVIKFLD